jgi:energy-coupling factor transporter transmembrane protein EcfT
MLRPWRLSIFIIILALAFVYGRLILFSILGFLLFISAIKVFIVEKKSYFIIIIPLIVLLLIFGIYYIVDYNKVRSYILNNSPLDLELVLDGTYEGVGQGLRGPIKVLVKIEDRIGAGAEIGALLGNAVIDVEYCYGTSAGIGKALLVFKTSNNKKAIDTLR